MSTDPSPSADQPTEFTFVGCPTYNGQISSRTHLGLRNASTRPNNTCVLGSSLLAFNFNLLFTHAMNLRENGCTHFAMLHADIDPERHWVDKLRDEMESAHAEVISAVVPIKSTEGTTSIAIDMPDEGNWVQCRLTMREVHRIAKPTFDAADAGYPGHALLINTGCMLVDLRGDWVDRFPGFCVSDEIRHDGPNGEARAWNEPEDFAFGRWLHDHGVRAVATRAVRVNHLGTVNMTNAKPWGLWSRDESYFAGQRCGEVV